MTQLLLLKDDGTTKCRKPLQGIADQLTIRGDGETTKFHVDVNAVAAALDGDGTRGNSGKIDADLVVDAPLSGAGRSDSHLKVASATNAAAGVMPHTGAGNIPADIDRDGSDISPAAVKKMFDYIKPVGVSGNLNASQLSQDAIEVPMLSGVSCTGGTNGNPKFTIPMENGGKCDIDLGALKGYGSGGGKTVWEGSSSGCVGVTESGLYYATVTNALYGTVHQPFINIVTPTPYCMVLRKDPEDASLNIIASGQVKGGSGLYEGAIITKIVKVA